MNSARRSCRCIWALGAGMVTYREPEGTSLEYICDFVSFLSIKSPVAIDHNGFSKSTCPPQKRAAINKRHTLVQDPAVHMEEARYACVHIIPLACPSILACDTTHHLIGESDISQGPHGHPKKRLLQKHVPTCPNLSYLTPNHILLPSHVLPIGHSSDLPDVPPQAALQAFGAFEAVFAFWGAGGLRHTGGTHGLKPSDLIWIIQISE